jgi:hypothetical protein
VVSRFLPLLKGMKRVEIDIAVCGAQVACMADQAAVGATMASIFSTKHPADFPAPNRSTSRSASTACQKGSFGINALPNQRLLPRSRLQSFTDVFLSTIKCCEPSFAGAIAARSGEGILP